MPCLPTAMAMPMRHGRYDGLDVVPLEVQDAQMHGMIELYTARPHPDTVRDKAPRALGVTQAVLMRAPCVASPSFDF